MLKYIFLLLLLSAIATRVEPLPAPAEERLEIAISIDDGNSRTSIMSWDSCNALILSHLRAYHLQAALFAAGKYFDNAEGPHILSQWDAAGHLIANHSYSHSYFNAKSLSLQDYEKDFLRGDSVIRGYKNYTRLYRFPFLKEGNTIEKRDGFRQFLKAHGYSIGYVSVDASDWCIDARLNKRLKADPHADISAYRQYYLDHIYDRACYYDKLAREVTGRHIKHVLLLHHNLLNAYFLDDLIAMLQQKGWKVINAAEAFADPIYQKQPDILPAGESLVWALAKETGRYDNELRYPGEDEEYEKDGMDRAGL